MSVVSVSSGTVASGSATSLTLPSSLVAGNWLVAVVQVGTYSGAGGFSGTIVNPLTAISLSGFDAVQIPANERYQINANVATGGSHTLSYGGATSTSLTRPYTRNTALAAAQGISTIGTNDVVIEAYGSNYITDMTLYSLSLVNGLGGIDTTALTASSPATSTNTQAGGVLQDWVYNGALDDYHEYSQWAVFKKQIVSGEASPSLSFSPSLTAAYVIYQLNTPVGVPSYVSDMNSQSAGSIPAIVSTAPGLDITLLYTRATREGTSTPATWTESVTISSPFTERYDTTYTSASLRTTNDLGNAYWYTSCMHYAHADTYRTAPGTHAAATYSSTPYAGLGGQTRLFIPEGNDLVGWGIPI